MAVLTLGARAGVPASPRAPSERRWTLIAIALVVAISALEIVAPPEQVFLGLLVVPPLVAAAGTRPRITAWIGVLALAAALALGDRDRMFLSQDHLIRVLTVLAAGVLAVVLATVRARSEQALAATYRISQSVHTAPTLHEQLKAIHGIVSELMPARNFYIALYDAQRDLISFPYFVDEQDEPPEPKRPGKGLTEYVLRTGRALLATPDVVQDLERRGEVELIGSPSVDWLGVPLNRDGATMGVLVVQSYTEGVRYTERDKRLLQFVSTQIAMAVERKRADEALRQSEEGLRDFVDNAVFGISRSTAEGRVVPGQRRARPDARLRFRPGDERPRRGAALLAEPAKRAKAWSSGCGPPAASPASRSKRSRRTARPCR